MLSLHIDSIDITRGKILKVGVCRVSSSLTSTTLDAETKLCYHFLMQRTETLLSAPHSIITGMSPAIVSVAQFPTTWGPCIDCTCDRRAFATHRFNRHNQGVHSILRWYCHIICTTIKSNNSDNYSIMSARSVITSDCGQNGVC